MGTFRNITPEELDANLFQAIGKDWMLVTAEHEGKINTMTASWGGAGILWGKPVAFVFIRPQRYTREFVDGSETLSLSFLPEQYRKQLALCGSESGRDMDKIAACGFTVAKEDGTPYFTQADRALICKKLYRQPLEAASFLDKGLDAEHYPTRDYHIMYVAEITGVLVK